MHGRLLQFDLLVKGFGRHVGVPTWHLYCTPSWGGTDAASSTRETSPRRTSPDVSCRCVFPLLPHRYYIASQNRVQRKLLRGRLSAFCVSRDYYKKETIQVERKDQRSKLDRLTCVKAVSPKSVRPFDLLGGGRFRCRKKKRTRCDSLTKDFERSARATNRDYTCERLSRKHPGF